MSRRANRSGIRWIVAGATVLAALLAIPSVAGAANGTWERAWGKNVNGGGVFEVCTVAANCLAGNNGGLGGDMSSPAGLATDSSGNVYVADYSHHRIQKFTSSGSWDRAWGLDVNGPGVYGVCTVAASCSTGSAGVKGGEMVFPFGVATDAAGNVYVSDYSNHRIQKFNSSGVWERAWGKGVDTSGDLTPNICTVAASCQAGTPGVQGGEMNLPVGVATDSGGNVYVADLSNNRVQKFDSSGNFQRAWGEGVNGGSGFETCMVATNCQAGTGTGGAGGEMSGPEAIATDAVGNVYVSDTGNHRIQKFNSSGIWERAWGKGVDTSGDLTPNICTVAASCQAGTPGVQGGEMNSPYGLGTDAAGNVYLADRGNNRIQKFDSSGNFQRAWGGNVNGGGGFGVCTVPATCLGGTTGSSGGEMYQPVGLASDSAGNVYISDTNNNRIERFADPAPPPPPSGGGDGGGGASSGGGGGASQPTGQRAAALKKCKKKHGRARRNCIKRANQLPV